MTDELVFEIPTVLPLKNVWNTMHWRTRHRLLRRITEEVAYATHGRRPKQPWKKVRIYIIRIQRVRGGRRPDIDAVRVEPLIDALTVPRGNRKLGMSIIEDDSRDHIELLDVCCAAPGPGGRPATIVRIERLDD